MHVFHFGEYSALCIFKYFIIHFYRNNEFSNYTDIKYFFFFFEVMGHAFADCLERVLHLTNGFPWIPEFPDIEWLRWQMATRDYIHM